MQGGKDPVQGGAVVKLVEDEPKDPSSTGHTTLFARVEIVQPGGSKSGGSDYNATPRGEFGLARA